MSSPETSEKVDECLVGSDRAKVIAHLVAKHLWMEWDATDLHAVHDLHAELHEQLELEHHHEQHGSASSDA